MCEFPIFVAENEFGTLTLAYIVRMDVVCGMSYSLALFFQGYLKYSYFFIACLVVIHMLLDF